MIEAPAALAVRCGRPVDRGLLEAVEVLGAAVDAHSGMLARDRTRIRNKLRSLRSQAPAGESLDTTMIRPGDGWSAAVLEQAARWRGDPGGANLLLRHLAAAAGSKPSRKGQDRAVALLADPGAEEVLRILVESAATAKAIIVRRYDWELPYLVSEPNADLLRAACWAAGARGGLGRAGAARHRRSFGLGFQPGGQRLRRVGQDPERLRLRSRPDRQRARHREPA